MTDKLLFLGLFKTVILKPIDIRLIALSLRPVGDVDTIFYKISEPAAPAQQISKNDLQISGNANSHTWSEFDNDGKITRQLATVITNLEPVDYQHSTDGLPHKINVLLAGKHIAKISTEISRHLDPFDIFRRTVSPAFFYKDAAENERIAVITATMQDPADGAYTGHCDVSRWSAEYDPDAIEAIELIENETVQLAATGILKQLITLNQAASNAAFAATNKGYVLEGLNSPVFAPSVRTAVDIPSETPAYTNPQRGGSGSETYDRELWRGRTYNRRYTWVSDGDGYWRTRCDYNPGIGKQTSSLVTTESFTSSDNQTTTATAGSLIAFGYDILSDTFNVLVNRPLYLSKTATYTNNDTGEFMDSDVPIESDQEKALEVSNRKQTQNFATITKQKVEFNNIPESSASANPVGNAIIDAGYTQNRLYQQVITESYGLITSNIVTENYDTTEENLWVHDAVDIAVGVIQVTKEVFHYLNESLDLATDHYLLDAKNSTQITLKHEDLNSAFNPPQLPFNNGNQDNFTHTPETNLAEAQLPDIVSCGGLPCGDPTGVEWQCNESPDSSRVYHWGDITGNSQNIGGGYPEPYVDTWSLI